MVITGFIYYIVKDFYSVETLVKPLLSNADCTIQLIVGSKVMRKYADEMDLQNNVKQLQGLNQV